MDKTREVIDEALVAVGNELTPSEVAIVPDAVSVTDETGSLDLGGVSIDITPLDVENSRVLARAEGVQALSVLKEGSSTAEFEFTVPNAATVVPSNGGYDVMIDVEDINITIAHVAAPWAVDAEGVSLPTEYTFANGVITQTVDTTGATFPVVADPMITLGLANAPQGPGFYLNMTGLMLKALGTGVIFAASIAPAVICLTLDKIPHPLTRNVVRTLCGLFGAQTVAGILDDLARNLKNSTYKNTSCYQTRLGSGKPFVATSKSNCA